MNVLVFFALLFGAMFLVPWLFEKFKKTNDGAQEKEEPGQRTVPAKRHSRKTKSHARPLQLEDEFPHWNPLHDDETEWQTEIEPKYRKHVGYPPDWERRRVLGFLRDDGRCQSREHRGATCGRLLCEPSQIWNFTYQEKRLVDAHVDHIKSVHSGSDHDLQNLQLLCARCHALKHPGNYKLEAMVLPRLVPGGRGRKKFLQNNFFTRKAPKAPDTDVAF